MTKVRLNLMDAKGRWRSVVVHRTGKSLTPPRENVNRSRECARRRRQMERAAMKRETKEATEATA